MRPKDERTHRSASARLWRIIALALLLSGLGGAAVGEAGETVGQEKRPMDVQQSVQATTVDIPVEGMSCGSCAASITRAVESVEGVRGVHIDLAAARVRVDYMAGATAPDRIAAAISALGYKPGLPSVVETAK